MYASLRSVVMYVSRSLPARSLKRAGRNKKGEGEKGKDTLFFPFPLPLYPSSFTFPLFPKCVIRRQCDHR